MNVGKTKLLPTFPSDDENEPREASFEFFWWVTESLNSYFKIEAKLVCRVCPDDYVDFTCLNVLVWVAW